MSRMPYAGLALMTITFTCLACGKSSTSHPPSTAARPTSALKANITPTSPATSTVPGLSKEKTKTLNRIQLIASASRICRRIATERDKLKFSGPGQFELIVPRLNAYQHALLGELSRLTPPPSMHGAWSQIISDAQTLAAATTELNRRAQENSTHAPSTLFALFSQAHMHLQGVARRNDITGCATY